MPTLTELSTQIFDLEQQLENAEGDEAQQSAITAYLESAEQAVEEKLENYCQYIRGIETRANFRSEEAKRMAHLSKVDSDKVDFLKDKLKNYFQAHELTRVETPRYRLTLASHGGKVPVQVSIPAEELPSEFRVETVAVRPNLDALRASLECGNTIDGVTLGEREQSIRIK